MSIGKVNIRPVAKIKHVPVRVREDRDLLRASVDWWVVSLQLLLKRDTSSPNADDMVAQAIKSSGGFVWACKNYDGDVMVSRHIPTILRKNDEVGAGARLT